MNPRQFKAKIYLCRIKGHYVVIKESVSSKQVWLHIGADSFKVTGYFSDRLPIPAAKLELFALKTVLQQTICELFSSEFPKKIVTIWLLKSLIINRSVTV